MTASIALTQADAGLSSLPLRRDAANDSSMTAAWLFLGVLAAAAVAAIRFRRLRKPAANARPALQRIESLALTSHASLQVVRWGDEEMLLGCTPGAIEVISRRSPGPSPHRNAS
jgi:flagellar biogenesis protein FliO